MRTSLFMGLCTLDSHSSSYFLLFLGSILSIPRTSWSTFRYICQTLPPPHLLFISTLLSTLSTFGSSLPSTLVAPLRSPCITLVFVVGMSILFDLVFGSSSKWWVVHPTVGGTCSFGTMAGSTHRLTFLGHALAGQAVEVEVRGHEGGRGTSMETTS